MDTNEALRSLTPTSRPLQTTAVATVVVLLVLLGFALLLSMRNVLASVFLGLLLATALRPLMSRLREGRLPSFVAASAAILLLLGLIAGAAVLIVPLVSSQADALSEALPSLYESVRQWLVTSELRLFRQIGYRLDPVPQLPGAEAAGGELDGQTIATLSTVGYLTFVTIATFVFAYYWLLYRERSLRGLLLLLPMDRRPGAEAVWLQIEERIGGFLRGQLILALITAGFSLVGYWVAGVPYAVLLAVIAGVLELVPFIGPFIATGVAVVVGFSEGTDTAIAALVVGIIVQQIENNVLAPRVMDETVGISPVVTLLAFVGFAALFGPAGALLAIPLAATLQVLFAAWVERRATSEEAAPAGRSRADRLRYAVREMASDIAGRLRDKEETALPEADQHEEELERIMLDLDGLLSSESDNSSPATPGLSLEGAR
jgi:predicted PurR-regulated permease PerM